MTAATRREIAEAIIESPSQRFNVASLPALTAYLEEQMADASSYSLKNNVAILKIYTLFPCKLETDVVQKILIQCLTQLPANDFNICLAQVPLPVQEQPAIAQIVGLHNILQSCMFYKFWTESLKPLVNHASLSVIDVPGIRESVRRFILDVVPLVYQHMGVPEMRTLLNFEKNCDEFEKLLESCKWTLEGGYKREDPQSGICVPSSRDDVMKQQKGASQVKPVEKYFKTESLRHYYTTMRNPVI